MSLGNATALAAVNFVLASLLAYTLYKIIIPQNVPNSASGTGRRWCAWVVAAATVTMLPRALNRGFDVDAIALWVLGAVVWGGVAFFVGWTWHTYFRRRSAGAPLSAGKAEVYVNSMPQAPMPDAAQPQRDSIATAWRPELAQARSSQAGNGWMPDASNRPMSAIPTAVLTDGEEQLYAAAHAEIDTGMRKLGLWAKCFAATNGVDAQATAMYLRERVRQLQAEIDAQRTAEAARASADLRKQAQAVEQAKTAFISGTKPTVADVMLLATAAQADPSLARLWERFEGETLLHWSARYGLEDQSRALLERGANAGIANYKGEHPFMLAATSELRDILFAAAQGRDEYVQLPKGTCPNCQAAILLASEACPKCNAFFGAGSAWQVTPAGAAPGS